MQIQIIKKDTDELVAWIDTDTEQIVNNDNYVVIQGENLKVTEENK